MLRQNSSSALQSPGGAPASQSLDALPKQFVMSMKKLFDILDDKQSGFVRYADIEKGWQDDGSKGLPQGVLDSLRRVTPSSGLLSFERFCAGLKLCLLRNQQQQQQQHHQPQQQTVAVVNKPLRPLPSEAAPTAKVRPRSQVALSTPTSPTLTPMTTTTLMLPTINMELGSPPPPPKPPRQAAVMAKSGIRHALHNWQVSLIQGGEQKPFEHRGSADGGSSSTSATDYTHLALQPKKFTSKRREARRHTLPHGIDYNMLKRLKQLEEERELLLFGLDGVEKARDWYMQQVLNVQEKIKYFGQLNTRCEQYSDFHQEWINYQRARVLEVNRNLAILTDTWEHGVYSTQQHINLALSTENINASCFAEMVPCEKQSLVPPVHTLSDQQPPPSSHHNHQQQFHNLRVARNFPEFALGQPSLDSGGGGGGS